MSTGGSARRASLIPLSSHAPSDRQMGQPTRSSDIQHCAMCQDGGTIWECDAPNCDRAICSKCIEIPPDELSKLNDPRVKFTCTSCHWKTCMGTSVPYYGFTIDGTPVLNNFLKVLGTFETATSATVHSPPTILLHLRLHSIRHIAHFTIIEQLLSEYYQENSQLRVIDAPFNVGHNQAVESWNDDAIKLMADLSEYTHVITLITTHSDPESGDLWLGLDERGKPCAAAISDWIDIILAPFKPILRNSLLYLLACGAVVNNASSFDALREGLLNLRVGNALAFDSRRLSTVNTVDLLTKVTKSVVIHGFEFSKALEHTLKECASLGKHTNVIHFSPPKVTQYLWAHKAYQPWGKTIPVQCPQCGTLNPWISVFLKDQGYQFNCKNDACGLGGTKSVERYSFAVARPPNSKLLTVSKERGGTASGWLKVTSN